MEASILHERGHTQQAVTLLEQAIALDPKATEPYYRLGLIYADMKDYEKAITYLQKVVEINPRYTNAYLNLGSAFGYLKQYDVALRCFLKALSLDTRNPKTYYNLGLTYWVLRDGKKAGLFLSKARQLCIEQKDTVLLEKIDKLYQK